MLALRTAQLIEAAAGRAMFQLERGWRCELALLDDGLGRVLWHPPRMHDTSETCAHGLLPSVDVTYLMSCVLAFHLPSSVSITPGSKWQSMQPTFARPCDESSHDFTYGTMLWHDEQNCGVVEYSMNA